MKKTKLNPDLLKEELKRFKLLNEYDFYQEKKELPEYTELNLDEDDKDNSPENLKPVDSETKDVAKDLGVDSNDDNEISGDIPDANPPQEQPENPEPPTPQPTPETSSDDVEIDVTSLVKGSKEAKHSADMANHNIEILLKKMSELEQHISRMDKVNDKIENLEKEIVKRNPTPVEKLEMRSLDSYPYSQKLSDYWSDKEGPYDVMNTKKEYVLKKDDIDNDYSPNSIKQSFDVNKNDYEEEDI